MLNKVENKKEKNEKLDYSEAKDFEKCVNDVFEIFKGEELHTIGNLTLLGKSENISLSNAVFAMKQQRIKELEQKGKFIPLCTRNVFLKYYTKEQNISQALFWSKQDSQDYQEEIIAKIQKYLFS
ncbi:HNH endonuclease family protein [Campylobacter felis]|uniref:GmrSD restriction endonuclease domain-containing protein n=1 Tax=Campylobacter felis TaxID=2974565 RepID=UPI00256DF6F9|nr:HNH endonuclease family protein [Campylobacter felis]